MTARARQVVSQTDHYGGAPGNQECDTPCDLARTKYSESPWWGAGTMGHSIAQVFAQAGIHVDLVDLDETALGARPSVGGG